MLSEGLRPGLLLEVSFAPRACTVNVDLQRDPSTAPVSVLGLVFSRAQL